MTRGLGSVSSMTTLLAATTALTEPMLLVDSAAITTNVRTIRAVTRGEVMAVVKADGFGHGLSTVARAALAGGAIRFGVTSLAEAVAVRAAGFDQPVLSWLNPVGADFGLALAHRVDLAVPSLDHLAAVVARAPGARVHLHLDTGMARDGASPGEWLALCRAARNAERDGLVRVVGMMGHLACAAEPDHPANTAGRALFQIGLSVAEDAGLRPSDRHLAATAATLSSPASHHTMSRIGAGLVGIDESGTVRLRPALTLVAPLVAVREVRAGTGVGYGHAWRAPSATRLGLLPVGYADGLPRAAAGRATVLVGRVRRPVVGRISMDMTVVDLGPSCDVGPGDPVVVFGPGDGGEPTAAEWAAWSDTLEHEFVTGLGTRLARA